MPLIMIVLNYTIQDLQLSSVKQRNKNKTLEPVPDERKTDENFHDMLHPDRAADRREMCIRDSPSADSRN